MGRRSFPYDAYKWQKLSWHAGRLDAAALQRAADESLLYRQVEAAVAAAGVVLLVLVWVQPWHAKKIAKKIAKTGKQRPIRQPFCKAACQLRGHRPT